MEINHHHERFIFESNKAGELFIAYASHGSALWRYASDEADPLTEIPLVCALVHPGLREAIVIKSHLRPRIAGMGIIQDFDYARVHKDAKWLAGAEWLILRPESPVPVLIPVEITVSPTPTR